MSNLIDHAKRELKLADIDGDIYAGELSKAVIELLEVFDKQGHSGMSGDITLHVFTELANFRNLTPLTENPEEWNQISQDMWNGKDTVWQNARNGDAFSHDGGKTYYMLSEGGNDRHREPMHISETYLKEEQAAIDLEY